MKHFIPCNVAILAMIVAIAACKKDSSQAGGNAITPDKLSGTYGLTALSASVAGFTINIYDSLPACEKDNLITLNANLTATFTDAGIACAPPEDSTGVWSLSGDSLYFSGNAAKIKSYDGKTLVLTGYPKENGKIDSTVIATTTLTKQ